MNEHQRILGLNFLISLFPRITVTHFASPKVSSLDAPDYGHSVASVST